MLVRDKTKSRKEYKGRPFDASGKECPCRPCCNNHDCGYTTSMDGTRQVLMECATRWNSGCPNPKPSPEHIFSSARGKVCRRCGARRG